MADVTTTKEKSVQKSDTSLTEEQNQFKHWRKVVIAACAGIAVSLGIYLEAIDIAFIAAMFSSVK
jgi:hypothetical protein